MKMNALSYMIKCLLCRLVNFQAAVYKNLLLAKCPKYSKYCVKIYLFCTLICLKAS